MDRNMPPIPDEVQAGFDIKPEHRIDRSVDHVAHVRSAREAAQREIDAFGDVSEYELRKVYGQHSNLDYGNAPEQEQTEQKHRPMPIPPDRYCYFDEEQDQSADDDSQGSLDFDAREREVDNRREVEQERERETERESNTERGQDAPTLIEEQL